MVIFICFMLKTHRSQNIQKEVIIYPCNSSTENNDDILQDCACGQFYISSSYLIDAETTLKKD